GNNRSLRRKKYYRLHANAVDMPHAKLQWAGVEWNGPGILTFTIWGPPVNGSTAIVSIRGVSDVGAVLFDRAFIKTPKKGPTKISLPLRVKKEVVLKITMDVQIPSGEKISRAW